MLLEMLEGRWPRLRSAELKVPMFLIYFSIIGIIIQHDTFAEIVATAGFGARLVGEGCTGSCGIGVSEVSRLLKPTFAHVRFKL